jgi:hypothetical protein
MKHHGEQGESISAPSPGLVDNFETNFSKINFNIRLFPPVLPCDLLTKAELF